MTLVIADPGDGHRVNHTRDGELLDHALLAHGSSWTQGLTT